MTTAGGTMKVYPYDSPTLTSNGELSNKLNIDYAKAKIPTELSRSERLEVEANIRRLLQERNAVLVAHYYVDPSIQELALATGGCVGDSLEMAQRKRTKHQKLRERQLSLS